MYRDETILYSNEFFCECLDFFALTYNDSMQSLQDLHADSIYVTTLRIM